MLLIHQCHSVGVFEGLLGFQCLCAHRQMSLNGRLFLHSEVITALRCQLTRTQDADERKATILVGKLRLQNEVRAAAVFG